MTVPLKQTQKLRIFQLKLPSQENFRAQIQM